MASLLINEIQSASLANSLNWKECFALPKSTKKCSTSSVQIQGGLLSRLYMMGEGIQMKN